jgi:hypothetical protein
MNEREKIHKAEFKLKGYFQYLIKNDNIYPYCDHNPE